MLKFDRKQQDSVKQLSFNKKNDMLSLHLDISLHFPIRFCIFSLFCPLHFKLNLLINILKILLILQIKYFSHFYFL